MRVGDYVRDSAVREYSWLAINVGLMPMRWLGSGAVSGVDFATRGAVGRLLDGSKLAEHLEATTYRHDMKRCEDEIKDRPKDVPLVDINSFTWVRASLRQEQRDAGITEVPPMEPHIAQIGQIMTRSAVPEQGIEVIINRLNVWRTQVQERGLDGPVAAVLRRH